jgi:catechol-2,3-dioxygenase
MAAIRYIVTDIDAATGFYRDNLDFRVDMHNPGKLFRGDISDGGAGRAILLEDPSGNIVELFEFKSRK